MLRAPTSNTPIASFNIGLEGVTGTTPTPGTAPIVTSAYASGKTVIVTGLNFSEDAIVFIDGQKYKKTDNAESSPSTMLIVRKAAKHIGVGQSVGIQVRNSDNTLSTVFSYTRDS